MKQLLFKELLVGRTLTGSLVIDDKLVCIFDKEYYVVYEIKHNWTFHEKEIVISDKPLNTAQLKLVENNVR